MQISIPKILILAGSSESGKSTAGIFLESLGALRIKIRNILLNLESGKMSKIGGAPTRINFQYKELFDSIYLKLSSSSNEIAVLESFTSPMLAKWLREKWTVQCKILYIDALEEVRVQRLSLQEKLKYNDAVDFIRKKDNSKGLPATYQMWKEISDDFIENIGSENDFKSELLSVYESLITKKVNN